MGKPAAALEIARPHNMMAAAACVFGGYYLSGGRGAADIVAPLVLTAGVTGLGNLINDYYDAEADRINKPKRPIPSGRLTAAEVGRMYWLGSALVLAGAAVWLRWPILALVVAWQVTLYVYARRGKRILIVGNVLIAAVAASAFVGGAMVAGDYSMIAFPTAFAFLFVMGRELVKGAEDVDGDSQVGARTVAVRFGSGVAARVSAAFLLACVFIAPLPGLLHHFGRAYAFMIELSVVPGILVATRLALQRPSRPAFRLASQILKIEMFFGIVAMALGRL